MGCLIVLTMICSMQSFLVLLGDGGSNPPPTTIDGHTPGMVKERV